MQLVSAVTHETVAKFVKCHLPLSQLVRSAALTSQAEIGKTQHHAGRVTPPDRAGEGLPWVNIDIGNLETFLLGTYHGVSSRYLQEYLNEFCYRFIRHMREAELPLRLLKACHTYILIKLKRYIGISFKKMRVLPLAFCRNLAVKKYSFARPSLCCCLMINQLFTAHKQ